MKSLELKQMEIVQGGDISCEGGWGITFGLIAGGFLLTVATAGAGLAVVAAGYAAGYVAGTNCGFGQN